EGAGNRSRHGRSPTCGLSVVVVLVVALAVPVFVAPAVPGPGRRPVLLTVPRRHPVVADRHGEDRARYALDRDEAPRPVEARGVEPVVAVEGVVEPAIVEVVVGQG